MIRRGLKLTVYFNESLRGRDGLAADLLLEAFERAQVRASVLLRGIEGFGLHHRLHTERFENTSLNQPIVAVAVDGQERIEALVAEVDEILPSGLVTTERLWMLEEGDAPDALPEVAHEAVKLTVYLGRAERADGQPAFRAITDRLQRSGVDGATVFLGVDGTVHGERQRARFFSRNARVPLMLIAVGDGADVARALPGVLALADEPVVTIEGIQVCKQGGALIGPPSAMSAAPGDPGVWRKLMIHAAGDVHAEGESLHYQLMEHLRREGASGATSLRGIWGYRGTHAPHGDSIWSIRRHSPVVTIVIERDDRSAPAWETVDRLTERAGLVTSEMVPAHRALGVPLADS